jgi:hypothetical protein
VANKTNAPDAFGAGQTLGQALNVDKSIPNEVIDIEQENVPVQGFTPSFVFSDRNEHFAVNPKRAVDKIWGRERVVPVFNLSNNCKDPLY